MKKIRLTREERAIEKALIQGKYVPVSPARFEEIGRALARRRKDAVLNIRVNSEDLSHIKDKARKLGVPYQSLISELLHQFAG